MDKSQKGISKKSLDKFSKNGIFEQKNWKIKFLKDFQKKILNEYLNKFLKK